MKRLLLLAALTSIACSARQPRSVAAVPSHAAHTPPLSLEYLGTAGWQITTGTRTLLIDPYFSRLDVDDRAAPLAPDAEAIAKYSPAHAEAILVTHSHYDHLLDVPDIAKRTGARIVGTESTAHVAHAAGIPDALITTVAGGEELSFGPLKVRARRSLHSVIREENALIPANVHVPLSADGYAEGNTLAYSINVAGHSILVLGTANFIESELTGLHPDIAIVGIKLRGRVPDFTCRLMRALGDPPLVLANHFDAHEHPFGPVQMDVTPEGRASIAKFPDEVHACSPKTKVVIPELLRVLDL